MLFLIKFYLYIKQDCKENKSRWSFLIRALKNIRSDKMVVFFFIESFFFLEAIPMTSIYFFLDLRWFEIASFNFSFEIDWEADKRHDKLFKHFRLEFV